MKFYKEVKMARGKCPKCDQLVTELLIDVQIHGKVHLGRTFACINFLCPNCNTVVGSQMDPAPRRNETVNLLMHRLRLVG